MSFQRQGGREHLRFVDTVIERIAPLLVANRFDCKQATPLTVQFESDLVNLTISHDLLAYEIEVIFATNAEPSIQCTLHDVLDATLGPKHAEPDVFQASTPERVTASVEEIARLLERYAGGLLTGDPAAYRQIRQSSIARNASETNRIINSGIRREADQAWRHQDYPRTRRLNESIEAQLTQVEAARLNYSRKMTQ